MELFDCVKLIKPFENLKVGFEGTILEKYSDNDYEVEFFDNNKESVGCYTISSDYLELIWIAKEHKNDTIS